MGSGFAKKKKQAKLLQQQFSELQKNLTNLSIEGSAGNGLVKLTLNGESQLTSISIRPDCVDPEDIEGLQDLIKAAHEDATKKLKEEQAGSMPFGGLESFGF